jgi:hypothetical protein
MMPRSFKMSLPSTNNALMLSQNILQRHDSIKNSKEWPTLPAIQFSMKKSLPVETSLLKSAMNRSTMEGFQNSNIGQFVIPDFYVKTEYSSYA